MENNTLKVDIENDVDYYSSRDNYMIKEITGKSMAEVLNDYTLPELLRLQALLVFFEGLPF